MTGRIPTSDRVPGTIMPRVRIKVCGLTHPDDVRAAAAAGADAVGFNFYPPSPRFVTDTTVESLARLTPPGIVQVGVFVEATAGRCARPRSGSVCTRCNGTATGRRRRA